jgi:hypothetical protein
VHSRSFGETIVKHEASSKPVSSSSDVLSPYEILHDVSNAFRLGTCNSDPHSSDPPLTIYAPTPTLPAILPAALNNLATFLRAHASRTLSRRRDYRCTCTSLPVPSSKLSLAVDPKRLDSRRTNGEMDGKRIRGRGDRGKARVKRKEVQGEDGWTVVTHGLSSMSLNKQDAGSLPSQVVEGLTAEKLQKEFNKLQERWEDTILAKQVETSLGGREWGVKEAVCIGIGSFSRDWTHRWRSLWQLVLFVGVVERRKLILLIRLVT